jgi:hypothetical protein
MVFVVSSLSLASSGGTGAIEEAAAQATGTEHVWWFWPLYGGSGPLCCSC